jgi:UDP-glucose 4-epimerase
MANVVVTGGAGFIGANLCRALLSRDHRVTVVDDLSEGERANLAPLEADPAFSLVVADIRDAEVMARVCREASHVAHLAARKIPRYGGALATLDVNAHGSRVVLEAACAAENRVVIASTSDAYGKNPAMPFTEYETPSVIGSPKVRRWSYAVSKMFEEQVAFALHEERGLAVTALRYFGGYGPFQHRGWLGGPQSVFLERAHAGAPLTIHGDGTQTRTFTYVDDMVEGTILALFSDAAVGELYNIGSTDELSILELAERCWRLARDDEPQLELIPYEALGGNYEDVLRRVPDPTKARAELGFSAQVSLDEGLARTHRWLLEHRLP